jgi:hypothetical protein
MVQTLLRCVFGFGLLLVISPFVVSSLLIDLRGVEIPSHVQSKSERVVVHYASWSRIADITVQYDPPDEPMVGFLNVNVDPDRFDQLKKGDLVPLRYLRQEDLPRVPGAKTLRQMHVLPRVRLADQSTFSGIGTAVQGNTRRTVVLVASVVLVLIFWRIARIPLFGWAVAVCVLCAIAIGMIHEFPLPVAPPREDVRTAAGAVKSLERVEWLFRDNHARGFQADQPIQIVGVQFVPDGRTEPVLAVDLIDAGSVPGLQEHAPVSIDYERSAPRTAHIHGATRKFPGRNLRGIAFELIASLVVISLLLWVASLFAKGYRHLTQRSM